MAVRHLKSRAFLSNGADRADVAKIQAGINALCIHIEGDRRYIHVPGSLAVAKECPLDAIRTRQQAQLRTSHARSAIIVRVQADDGCLALAQVAAEPFD